MNLPEHDKEELEGKTRDLAAEKVRLQAIIELAEPFEMLRDNSHFLKIQAAYKKSAGYYADKIQSLCNDVAVDNRDGETTLERHYRIADMISKAVVARDTLDQVSTDCERIIQMAKEARQSIDEINAKLTEEKRNA